MNYDQCVDTIVQTLLTPGFPIVLSFDEDADIRISVRRNGDALTLALPGEPTNGTIDAETRYPLAVMQNVLKLTPCGFMPKGLIRAAYAELKRREENRRAFTAAEQRLREHQASKGEWVKEYLGQCDAAKTADE